MRICITDVAYVDDVACAACVVAHDWTDQFPAETHAILKTPIAAYVPGRFRDRELPCLLAVLDGRDPAMIVVDGYVFLDAAGRAGLGAALHDALGVPVIGVAKTSFEGSAHAERLLRGRSGRPLFVTAVGIALDRATDHIAQMHGSSRIPTLLNLADRVARAGRATR